jgi:hypothetical protein
VALAKLSIHFSFAIGRLSNMIINHELLTSLLYICQLYATWYCFKRTGRYFFVTFCRQEASFFQPLETSQTVPFIVISVLAHVNSGPWIPAGYRRIVSPYILWLSKLSLRLAIYVLLLCWQSPQVDRSSNCAFENQLHTVWSRKRRRGGHFCSERYVGSPVYYCWPSGKFYDPEIGII